MKLKKLSEITQDEIVLEEMRDLSKLMVTEINIITTFLIVITFHVRFLAEIIIMHQN